MLRARIMIVEDEVIIAQDLACELTELHYEIISTVLSGEKAIDQAPVARPDLIIMDIKLAGKVDGIEAARIIRSRFEIPIIFLTADTDDDRLKQAQLTLPFGYILKPFESRQLKVAIDMALYVAKMDRERKKVENALQESEAKFRALYEFAPVSYQSLDADGCFLDVNQAWLEKLGYAREEVIGRPFIEFLHPEWRDHFAKNFHKIETLGDVTSVQFEILKKDGSCIFVEFDCKISRDEKKKSQQTHCVFYDITEKRKYEEQLKQWADILNYAQWGVMVSSADGKVLEMMNQAFAKMHGYAVDELSGQPIAYIIAPDFLEEFSIQMRFARENEHYVFESKHSRKDNSTFPVLVDVTTVKDEGLVTYCIINVQDITERKMREAAMREREELLHRLVITDSLTGVNNRRHLMVCLAVELKSAQRHKYPLSVCMCDLDNFKMVNDTHGHQIGDHVLIGFGKLLKEEARTEDIIGRYGGEEFTLVLPHTPESSAVVMAERIRSRLEKLVFYSEKGESFTITASFGISQLDSSDLNETDLLGRADKALYRAKAAGRNQVVVHEL
ncbi:MAG: diguanylate cyclase [Deltaproteobacteria bacterium]|nr:diguanylate cyclase [Deltaproteobacteria bacterium]